MVTYDAVQLLPYFSFIDSSNNIFRYSENSYHRPIFGSAINPSAVEAGTILYSFTNATPRKGREFSEIELPVSLDDVEALTDIAPAANCIRIQKSVGKPKPLMIYGWVDSIEPISTKGPSKNTLIRFHVDYWLTEQYYTWFANTYTTGWQRSPIRFANGRVKRGPASVARPDPSDPRRWVFSDKTSLGPTDKDKPWIVVCYIKKETILGFQYTTIGTLFWQPDMTITDGGVSYTGMSLDMCYMGWIEERLNLDADSIIGVYLCPFQPFPYTAGVTTVQHGTMNAAYYQTPVNAQAVTLLTLNDPVMTDDGGKYIITDPTGAALATIPWGQPFTKINAICDVSPLGCNMILQLVNGTATGNEYSEGMVLSIPLQSVSVTSNSYSSYVYSGERDYDITMRRIQQEQNAVSGALGAGETALGGALAGGLAGAAGGGIGIGAGAALGLGMGLAKAQIGYLVGTHYDAKTQAAVDKLKSNQAGNVLVTSGGGAWRGGLNPGFWYLTHLVRDSESLAELTGEQTELGYVTDYFTTNAGTLINAGGPLRIEGLQVDGDITPAGRANIQALFARGVHLDLIQ